MKREIYPRHPQLKIFVLIHNRQFLLFLKELKHDIKKTKKTYQITWNKKKKIYKNFEF